MSNPASPTEYTTVPLTDAEGHQLARIENGVLVVRNGKRCGAWPLALLVEMSKTVVAIGAVCDTIE